MQEPTHQPGAGRGAKAGAGATGGEEEWKRGAGPRPVLTLSPGFGEAGILVPGRGGTGIRECRTSPGTGRERAEADARAGKWRGKRGAGPRPVFTPGVRAGAEAEQPGLGKCRRSLGHRGAGGHPLPGAQPRRPRSPHLTSAACVPPREPDSRTARGSVRRRAGARAALRSPARLCGRLKGATR